MESTIFITNRIITFKTLDAIFAKEQKDGWIENLWMQNCRIIDVPDARNPFTLFGSYIATENGVLKKYPVFMGYKLRGKCILENNIFSSEGI